MIVTFYFQNVHRWTIHKPAVMCEVYHSVIHVFFRQGRHISCSASFLSRDAMHKRGICRHPVSVCPSVCLSVTFVSCAKTNKDIFEIFSPSGSQAIPVFPYQTGGAIQTGTPLWGRRMQGGYEKLPIFFTNISLYRRNGYT